jgi:electron transfer flavoprotein alpha subunit
MSGIRINHEKCTLCGTCIESCPFNALEIQDGKVEVNAACKLCKLCIKTCPEGAIYLEEVKVKAIDKSKYKGVLVFAEQVGGKIHPVTRELIGKGQELAKKLGHQTNCVCIGYNITQQASELLQYGVDNVFVIDDPALKDFKIEPYTSAMEDVIKKTRPNIVLVGATSIGRSLAPRVAVRFRTGLTADCTVLDVKENGDLVQIRPAFGGNIMAQIVTPNHRPQMATVRYKVMEPAKVVDNPEGRLVNWSTKSISLDSRISVVDIVRKAQEESITEADIIVAAGRGFKRQQDLELAQELTTLLGGQLAVTRPLIEAGWASYTRQIGLSGRTVRPKLIITCGISGSVQFVAGMKSADAIFAINTDVNAPIFNIAHYAIVGDLYEVLPNLISMLKSGGELYDLR